MKCRSSPRTRDLLAWVWLTAPVIGQVQAPAPPAAKPSARVALEQASGAVEVRDLAGLEITDPRSQGISLVRFEGLAAPPPAAAGENSGVVELANGDRLHGRVRGGRAELLDVELAGGVHVGVAIDELASLVFPARIPDTWTGALAAPEEGDVLYRRTQDGLDPDKGGVEEFTTDGVRFHGQVGSRLVPWTEVAALFIESLEPETPRADDRQRARAVVDLTDQSRLRGKLEKIDAQGVRIVTDNGETLNLPAAVVAGVLVDDGKLAFLSSIAPTEAVDSAPFGDALGMVWPHQVDRSVTGTPLVAGGRRWARGLGVHAPSRLVWKLDGAWSGLRGTVAVDDQTLRLAARGSVVFRIQVDGRKLWESPVLHGGDPPLVLPPQSLADAQELVLEVDVAGDGHAGDRANWLDLRLVR